MRKCFVCPLLILVCLFSTNLFAAETVIFGPHTYTRTTAAFDLFTDTFAASDITGRLVVHNGEQSGEYKVTSGVISINGVEVFTSGDFQQGGYLLERPVALTDANILQVNLTGDPDSRLEIEIFQDVSSVIAFGPQNFERTTGAPNVYSSTFPAVNVEGRLIVCNGTDTGGHRITSGAVILNGVTVFSADDFKQGVYRMERTVNLAETNQLSAELSSKPGTWLTIEVVHEDVLPKAALRITPGQIVQGRTAALTWTTIRAENVIIEPGIGEVGPSGSMEVTPEDATTYTLTAVNAYGTATDSAAITVIPLPEVNISASPQVVVQGNTCQLSWTSRNADTVFIDNGIGSVELNGVMTVAPEVSTAYTATAAGPGGAVSSTIMVTVIHPPTITIIEPDGVNDTADDLFAITWTDDDPDSNAVISLYYDTDNTGEDGTLIAGGIPEDPDGALDDQFLWNTSAVSPGVYYIYAVIDDGQTPPVVAYSSGPVTVSHNTLPAISITSIVSTQARPEGYEYLDSRNPGGPVYNWVDITALGTKVTLGDNNYFSVNLPFAFPFYEVNKTTMRICSNGFLTFGTSGTEYSNTSIPNSASPNDFIAPFWDDLNPALGGTIHYYYDSAKNYFVVQYTNILPKSGSGAKTFQVILYPDGKILFQYKSMSGTLTSATVGVENANGTKGLKIAYNTTFLTNERALLIVPSVTGYKITWDDSDPDSNAVISLYYDTDNTGADGVLIAEGISEDPDGGINDQYIWKTANMPEGTYYIYAKITDGENPPVVDYFQEQVTINHSPCFTQVPDKQTMEGQALTFTVSASDPENDPLTYSASSLPTGAAFTPSTRTFAWTPTAGQAGVFYPQFTVTDGTYSATMTVKITVTAHPPVVSISASPQGITYGESATLSWTSSYASACSIEPNIGEVPLNGTLEVSPRESTTYVITASNPSSVATASVSVTVIKPPQIRLSVSDKVINYGESVTLTWSASPCQTAYFNNGIGQVAASGSKVLKPAYTTTYEITAVNNAISTHQAISVKVLGHPPALLPEGSFGEQYNDIIPEDASLKNYDPKRFIVVTGLVQDINGNPLPGVTASVIDHPEYGSVQTDETGRYAIPAEGGSLVKVNLEEEGYLTAQRQRVAGVMDVVAMETVTMVMRDPASTVIAFNGNPDTVITHQSTEVSDEFGSRSCTLVFTGDNFAYSLDRYGNVVEQLPAIIVRATEYTTPESMPAILPPTSAFTYCVELEAEGEKRIKFDKPVTFYVDNFLGFNVGTIVPVGYYDRDMAVWVPSKNGVVVKLLDTDSDGVVDALDATGDNLPDDLDNDGLTTDEAAGLASSNYSPGTTYWRCQINHFTPVDPNLPWGPPGGSGPPNPDGPPAEDEKKEDCDRGCGSFVNERGRIMHQDIPVLGTDMTFHYASDRAEGYKTIIDVPASGDTVPAPLKSIKVLCEIAGRTMQTFLPPLPNQKAQLGWNGKDYRGKQVSTAVDAHIKIGFVYDAVYYNSWSDLSNAFAQAGESFTRVSARDEIIFWKEYTIKVSPQPAKASGNIADGWTISTHHTFNPGDTYLLYKGDGTNIGSTDKIITTVAGGGTSSGSSGPATQAQLDFIDAVALDQQGNLFITDTENERILKVDTNGMISVFAGRKYYSGFSGDGGLAGNAQLNLPMGVALDQKGNLFIADSGNNRIRKVDTNGIITTVAGCVVGGFSAGYSGDNGPATLAQLNYPTGVALDQQGNLFIADYNNNRIRKVDTKGIITTVAGNGYSGYSGDNGSARQARLNRPWAVALDQQGNLFIADYFNNRIRKVAVSGIITTVAGGGSSYGDNGPATQAQLSHPRGIVLDHQGNLFIADSGNDCIRKVDISGIISTIAGNGSGGYNGDDGPAMQAQLNFPTGVALDQQNNLLIADWYNCRVRKIAPPSIFSTLAGVGDVIFSDTNGQGYILNSAGQHQKTIDLDTGKTLYTFAYDKFGEKECLTAITDQFSNQTFINRYSDGTPYSIVSPDGLSTLLLVDANNHLTRVTLPDNGVYSFIYAAGGLMTNKTEPVSSHIYQYAYDQNGRITDTYDSRNGHWQFDRYMDSDGIIHNTVLTAENNQTSYMDETSFAGQYISTITSPAGGETVYTKSADGLSVQKDLACGMSFAFTYDLDPEYKYKYVKQVSETTPTGLVRTIAEDISYEDSDSDKVPDLITRTTTLNASKTFTFENDVLASTRVSNSPEGRTTTSTYNPDTLVTTSTQMPGLNAINYTYYTDGKLKSISTGMRNTSFAYDANGYLSSVTDPKNLVTSFTNDKAGRVTYIERPDGTNLEFAYDESGNMTVLTNPSNVDHGFAYNRVDLVSDYTTPASGSYSYVYDKDRRLIEKNFPSGRAISFDYENPSDPNDKSRLWRIGTPERDIDYTYLCGEKVGSVSSGSESITYTYDGKLVTAETLAGTLNKTLGYTWNTDFALSSFTYAGGTESFTYDDDGLLTGAGSFTISRYNDPGVNETGLPYNVSNGALSLNRTFNGYGETGSEDNQVNGQDVYSWSVADRYADGRIKTKTETIGGATVTYDYSYDALGRLLSVVKDGALAEEYAYDNVPYGTCTYQVNALRGITGREISYDSEDRLLSVGGTDYAYDADGFLTSKSTGTETTGYNYSSRGELLGVVLPDGKAIQYVHDPLGRRIAKKVNGAITEKYLWSGLTTLLAVYDGSNNLLMRFRYADGRMPVAVEKAGATYYLAYDQVGTLRAVADSTGNVIKEISYDSFGFVLNDSNPGFNVPFGFAGGLYDKDTGLVRFGFRDYDPDTGRWTAKDPILFAGGDSDLYGYVLCDPINAVDPVGLFLDTSLAGWSGFILADVSGAALITGAILGIPVSPIIAGAGLVVGVGAVIYSAIDSIYEGPRQWSPIIKKQNEKSSCPE